MKKQNKETVLYNLTDELDEIFGAPGTESRKKAEEQAWEEYEAQVRGEIFP